MSVEGDITTIGSMRCASEGKTHTNIEHLLAGADKRLTNHEC